MSHSSEVELIIRSHEAQIRNGPEVLHGNLDRSRALATPAFYKPPPRWHFFVAFVGAIALELAAVAVAGLHEKKEIPIEPGISQAQPPADVILTDLAPEPTPLPEENPPPPPLPPIEPNEFEVEKAVGYCQGTPLRKEIEARDASLLGDATVVAVKALGERFGQGTLAEKFRPTS